LRLAGRSGAIVVAERIRAKVEATAIVEHDLILKITLSISVAHLAPDAVIEGVETLVQLADTALYQSKAGGRNRVTPASPPADLSATDVRPSAHLQRVK
jgi:diguanylate cyclase (GGDEF)-like protein